MAIEGTPIEEGQREFAGANGETIAASLFAPRARADEGAAVVVAPDVFGRGAALLSARFFARRGFVALVPDLWVQVEKRDAPVSQATRWSVEASFADRRALADLEGAFDHLAHRDDVASGRICAVGLGSGGTLAFLSGCTSRKVAAVVAIAARVLYPDLCAHKPVQPLEMLLNLDRPLLVVCGTQDPVPSKEERALSRAKLEEAGKDFEFEVYPGALLSESSPPPRAVLERAAGFLGERA